jgi:hypothetical protein
MCDDLILAAKYLPKERLGSTDDCGFSTLQYRARTEAWVAGCGATSFQTLELRVDGPELRRQSWASERYRRTWPDQQAGRARSRIVSVPAMSGCSGLISSR